MTNQLTELRRSIVTALEAEGLHAFDHIPPKITPPFAFVGPGDPYVHYGETGETPFGKEVVDHVVVLAVRPAHNRVMAEQLDDMVCKALRALKYQPSQVDQPGQIDIAGIGACYAVSLPIRHLIALE